MSFVVRLSSGAIRDLQQLRSWLNDYSFEVARKHVTRIAGTIDRIAEQPFVSPYFFLTGFPYRAKLFFIGRASFWIIYEIDEEASAVHILRVWNSKQNPDDLEF